MVDFQGSEKGGVGSRACLYLAEGLDFPDAVDSGANPSGGKE